MQEVYLANQAPGVPKDAMITVIMSENLGKYKHRKVNNVHSLIIVLFYFKIIKLK
jgi:hypothetical protein